MVSWLPPVARNENSVSGVRRQTSGAETYASFDTGAYRLASAGTVDLNGPTRLRYYFALGQPIPPGYADAMDIFSSARLRYTAADVTANNGRIMTATQFLAPATAFAAGVVPTPAQIMANAVRVIRGVGSPGTRTTAGDLILSFFSVGTLWQPNRKYWVAVVPTSHIAGSTPSVANDPVLAGSNANVVGRAISVWTNRTPEAPVITSPPAQTTVLAGSLVPFSFVSKDPDRLTSFPGDIGPNDFEDMAGIEVQYAPQPTVAVPNPEWKPLIITDGGGAVPPPVQPNEYGWYIVGANNAGLTNGARWLWITRSMKIACSRLPSEVPGNAAILPSGKWQIRMRTFDFGHPFPDSSGDNPANGLPPLLNFEGTYRPETYPFEDTSPWSVPVSITVSEQVPAPVPVSPVEDRAVLVGSAVTLRWQYRNTYTTPLPQAKRTVQIRKVGDSAWTTLVNDQASASPSYVVSGFDLVSGNRYEWRVKVKDSSGVESEYSNPAQFWYVPAPDTGGVLPDPGSFIDGATLGCGTHRVEIYRRGGKVRVGEITGISNLKYNRLRDDVSTAKIDVTGWNFDCGELLSKLQSWAYEVVIFRDNGFSVDRVWEGPITLLTYEHDSVTIHAKDVMAYAYRRIVKQAMSDFGSSPTAGDTVVRRAERVLQNAFAPDDPNVLEHMKVLSNVDDPKQYRTMPAYSRTAFEEVDDMAANAGLDYTVVGRATLLWSTKHRIGTLPEFRDSNLGSLPIVSEYGMSMANRYAVSDGNGVYGEATRLNADGQDPVYGLVEMLSSTWASESEGETGTYTEAGLETIRESFRASSERSIADRYPPPVVVRVPDNSRLNPKSLLSIQHLVPGVVIPLRSTGTLRQVAANQKLDSMTVTETNGEESITITMSPFSRDDIIAEGEGAE